MHFTSTPIILALTVVSKIFSTPCPSFDVDQLKSAINKDPKIDKPPFTFNIEEPNNIDPTGFYSPDKIYVFRVTSNDEKVKFKSLLVQPRLVAEKTESATIIDQKVGDFIEDESWTLQGIQLLSCAPLVNDSLARLQILEPVDNAIFKWNSPPKTIGPIQIVLTILAEPNILYESWLPLQGLLLPVNESAKLVLTEPENSSTIKPTSVGSFSKALPNICLEIHCKNGGSCVQNGSSFGCKCPENFLGQFCQWECPAYLCQNGGKCTIDKQLSYVCLCKNGFSGNHCEEKSSIKTISTIEDTSSSLGSTSESPLSTKSVIHNGVLTTVSTIASVSISVKNDASIALSTPKPVFAPQALLSNPNLSLSHASIGQTSSKGAVGAITVPSSDNRFFSPAVDEAKPEVHAIFETFVRKHSSTNRDGLLDFRPPDACSNHECRNGAVCIPSTGKAYICKCAIDFSGELCQWGCPAYLCQNGGTCFIDDRRNYKCHCPPGFEGLKCDQKNNTEDTTVSIPPIGEPINGTELWLTIKGLFAPSRSVQNLIDQNFKNTNEQFDSSVLQKIEDAPIDNKRRVKFLEAAEVKKGPKELLKILLDPDYCDTNFCYNNGTCRSNSELKKPECLCSGGWTGPRCSIKDFCFKHECQNNAECTSGFNGYTCKCRPEFSGKHCATPCPSSTCQNGAKCRFDDASSSYACDCLPGFAGEKCQTQIDDCKFQPCHNGATCVDKINGFECQCPKGFMGSRCHLPCKDSYKKCEQWKGEGKCVNEGGLSSFFKNGCPASCGSCNLNSQSGGSQLLSPISLEPLHFLLGRWVLNSTDSRQYPYDVENTKNGYYQEMEVSHSETVVGGRPTLNYTTVVINNDNPKDKVIRVGLLSMSGNATHTNGSLYTTGSDGITIAEEGELSYLRLDLNPIFIDAPKDKENKVTTKVTRTFSLFGIYLKEAVDRNLNGTPSYFTKFYYKAS